jgi:hypothetical protein
LAVGIGKPKHADRYCGRLAPSISCIVSETHELHTRYGIRRSSGASEIVRSLAPSVRALQAGHFQGAATGDIRLKHATLLVDVEGIVVLSQYGDFVGDHPDIDTLLAEYRALNP